MRLVIAFDEGMAVQDELEWSDDDKSLLLKRNVTLPDGSLKPAASAAEGMRH